MKPASFPSGDFFLLESMYPADCSDHEKLEVVAALLRIGLKSEEDLRTE